LKKIRLVGADLYHADGGTGKTTLTVASQFCERA